MDTISEAINQHRRSFLGAAAATIAAAQLGPNRWHNSCGLNSTRGSDLSASSQRRGA